MECVGAGGRRYLNLELYPPLSIQITKMPRIFVTWAQENRHHWINSLNINPPSNLSFWKIPVRDYKYWLAHSSSPSSPVSLTFFPYPNGVIVPTFSSSSSLLRRSVNNNNNN